MINFYKNLSLRNKIILIVLTISVITTSLGTFLSLNIEIAGLKENITQNATANAKLISQYCAMPLEFRYPEKAVETLEKLNSIPFIYDCLVFDSNDSLFASYHKSPSSLNSFPKELKKSGYSIEGNFIHVINPIRYNDKTYGIIYLRAYAGISELIIKKIISSGLLILGMLLLTFILTTILQKFITAPIIHLKDFTNRIAETKDYSFRIEQKYNDEVGKLYSEFNFLLQTIQNREQERNNALISLKESEDNLRQNRNMLLHIMDSIPQSVFWKNRNLTYLGCNQVFARSAGFDSPAQMIGKNDYDLPWRDYADSYNADDREVIDKHYTKHHILEPVKQSDGTIQWCTTTKVPLLDSDGNVYGVLGVLEDTTERKKAEDALRDSEAYNKVLFRDSIVPHAVMDSEKFIFTDCNDAAAKVFGYNEREEILGKTPFNFVSPVQDSDETGDNILTGQINIALKKGSVIFDLKLIRPTGEIWYAEIHLMAFVYNNKTLMKFSIIDITERKQATESIRSLSRIVENSLSEVYVFDTESLKFVYVNNGALKNLGYSLNEMLTMTPVDIKPQHTMETFTRQVEPLLTGEKESLNFQTIQKRKDGSTYPVEVNLQLSDYEGKKTFAAIILDVTERTTAERKLKENEFFLARAQEIAHFGSYRLDIKSGSWTSSRILDEIFGIDEYYLKNVKGWIDLIHPEDQNEMNDYLLKEVIGNKKLFDREYRIIRISNKELRWVHGTGDLEYDNANNPARMIGTIQDITERKKSEDAIHASEMKYRLLFENMTAGFALHEMIYDETGKAVDYRYLEANPAFEKLTGIPINGLIGQTVRSIIPNIEEYWINIYGEVAKTGKPISFLNYVKEIGRYYDTWAFSPAKDRFAVVFTDITDKKVAEEALVESREKLKFFFDTMVQGVVIQNETGAIIEANEAACRILGLSMDNLLGKSTYDPRWKLVHDDLSPFTVDEMPSVIALKEGRPVFNVFFGIFVPEIESYHWVLASSIPRFKPGQIKPYMTITTFTDVTERRTIEEELNRHREHLEELVAERTGELAESNLQLKTAKDAAEAASKAKSIFLANMSHELRTPMNAIIGFSEILERLVVDGRQRTYLSKIQASGNTLLSLINDVLDLSKIEAGKLALKYTPVSISKLFDETFQVFGHRLAEKNLDYSLEIHRDIPASVILDEVRLRQILLNLIGNAIKFTHKGRITLKVWPVYAEMNGHSSFDLYFSVEDTGIGIPKDQFEMIFEPFEQQKGKRNFEYGGTGLGLSITKTLINALNGNITVKSTVDKGSCFTVVLKSVEICIINSTESAEAESKLFDYDSITFGKASILVVDDIDYNRDLVKGYLSGYNLNLIEAENGSEALEIIYKHKPDLILLDMKMPVMDGYVTASILKNDVSLKNIPIVSITASALTEDEMRISSLCDGYLRKPMHRYELIEMLMKFLPHSVEAQKNIEEFADKYNIGIKGQLETIPKETINKIIKAAKLADLGKLRELIASIEPGNHDLAMELFRFVDKFNYDALIKLIKTAGKKNG